MVITVSDDEIDLGDNDDLNELFIEEDDESLDPNEGEIKFKLPFIDWLLFHLLLFACIKCILVLEILLVFEFDEFNVNCTAEAAAANCGEGDESDGEGEDKPAEEEDLDDVDDDEQLEEKEEHGEFLYVFLNVSLIDDCVFSMRIGSVTDWVIETAKTPLGTGGFIETDPFVFTEFTSDKRFEWFLKLST